MVGAKPHPTPNQIGVGFDLSDTPDNSRPANAKVIRQFIHTPLIDPPFACQLGVIDETSLPGERVKC
jgi:hypothetical protein